MPVLLCWLTRACLHQRYMDELTVMEAPAATSMARGVLLEVTPEIYDALMRDGDWPAVAAHQLRTIPRAQEDREITKMADVYANEAFDDLLGEAKCFECGKPGVKRCSRCKNAWYCGRKCQVKNWKAHKKVCDLVVDATKADADSKVAAAAEEKAAAAAAKRAKKGKKGKRNRAAAARAGTSADPGAGAGAGTAAGAGAGAAAGGASAGAASRGAEASPADTPLATRSSPQRVLVEEVVE